MSKIPFNRVNWPTSIFLISTLLISLTAVPIYLWHYGLDGFQVTMFLGLATCSSMSITIGYHRLFSHYTFRAKWPVRVGTLIFGAAAFEGSALDWVSDHRRHHKHVDHDEDPYDISKGFFHAHIGWLLFKLRPEPPMDNVSDLLADQLVMWQHRFTVLIGVLVGFALPTLLGYLWGGPPAALGGFLLGGVLKVVCVQHSTFFINSFCHYIGKRPYSSRSSARDSWIMALFTFGEGYHNFHHEFSYDYRNGVKPWQFDPTKWAIWTMSKLRLATQLRRVPLEKIQLAEIIEQQRQLELKLNTKAVQLGKSNHQLLQNAQERLRHAAQTWEQRKAEYVRVTEKKIEASRERINELKHEFDVATADLRAAIQTWHHAHQLALAKFA
jgi:stearoyl-CoA desaturase (delta-9 desaturase)